MNSAPIVFTLMTATLALGCASTKPTQARAEVSELVEARAGLDAGIEADQRSEAAVREHIEGLLAAPLTQDAALRIALVNNRGLLAVMEELGVAQSDLVQAGLLANPMIGGDLVFSTRGNGLGGGLSLSQSLLSVFLIPAKHRVAKAALKRTIVAVSDEILTLIRDVKIAYAQVHAARIVAELQRQRVQAAEVADELAHRQIEAGNITPLRLAEVAHELDEARLELLDRELEVALAREQLTLLMGLWGENTGWALAEDLSELPAQDPDLRMIVAHGIRERLDLSAARFEVEAVDYALKLRRRGVIADVDIGLEARNEVGDDAGHEWVVGPSLSIELPIFDPGHADFARLRAQLRQAQHLYQHRAIRVRTELRQGSATLVAARRRAFYMQDTVLPRQQHIYDRVLVQYNGMLRGAYDVFEARSEQLHAQQEHAEAIGAYWAAHAELEYRAGGRLPRDPAPNDPTR